MADILTFTITSNDWNTDGGITISGTYTGGGSNNGQTNNEDIQIQVLLDNGTWANLGTPNFNYGAKTFSLAMGADDLALFNTGAAINTAGNAVFRVWDTENDTDGNNTPEALPVTSNGDTDSDPKTFTHKITTESITGFSVNQSTSELNPAGGITLRGTFTGGGTSNQTTDNNTDIVVQVRLEGTNTWYTLSPANNPAFSFNYTTRTYEFNTTDSDLARYALNNNVEFRFTDVNQSGSSDDVILTTTTVTLCFYPGTMIATPEGEKAVETLEIGDMVLLQDGSAAPVRWMGRNTISLLFADKLKSLPIRIRKDALGENVPSRDLLVSPDHAILVEGILAQAATLVNGTSIVRETNVPGKFTYHHIELAQHAIVMAENTPAETFVDNVDRMAYDNWAEHEALFGDLPAIVEMDLPRAKSQRQVPAAIRKALADRAVALGYSDVISAVA
ncbi:Hint domain-containing protein [Rhizobium sp.]